ncbi:sensor histidine kinase [Tissierella sp. MSJ-40]|uniref:histidine kinase n=1 Tax=Tissierella simiarum TaxID=2841534 RepID=A0ABS6E551_9FIRM|nr:sensor histidine kinase [Tissierella simiarum]MBU5438047.1 sensor histidine kinase [Tissierella simiarum]
MNILVFFISSIFLLIGYVKWIKEYKDLRKALYTDEPIDMLACQGNKLEQELIRQIIDFKKKEKLREVTMLKEDLEEISDYITQWAHEIKIPISVCDLIADKVEEEDLYNISEELRQELERIKFLTNQVLYISRVSSYSEDLIIEEVNLKALVTNVIKNNMNFFINKNIDLKIHDLDFNILTDKKWTSYILEQIINNACKYVNLQGKIEIYAKENEESVRLFIKDNGIGIPQKDIGRIFDRGFTGDNGRKTTKSTGMGLYICNKIASKLNHKIEVFSKQSQYTEFIIVFYNISDYFNVTNM